MARARRRAAAAGDLAAAHRGRVLVAERRRDVRRATTRRCRLQCRGGPLEWNAREAQTNAARRRRSQPRLRGRRRRSREQAREDSTCSPPPKACAPRSSGSVIAVELLGIGGDLTVLTGRESRASRARRRVQPVRIDLRRRRFEPLLPMLLERAGLAYTGSRPLSLALAAAQAQGQGVLRARRRPHARRGAADDPGHLGRRAAVPAHRQARARGRVGRHHARFGRARPRRRCERQVALVLAHYNQPALVERYIEGREIYVSMLGRPGGGVDILPLYEIDFSEMPAGAPAHRLLRGQVGRVVARVPRDAARSPARWAPRAASSGAGGDARASPRWSCATTRGSTFGWTRPAPPTSST